MSQADPRKRLEDLTAIVQELIETLHLHAKSVERFAELVEQQTDLRDFPRELAVTTSKLTELAYRVRKLAGTDHAVVGREGE